MAGRNVDVRGRLTQGAGDDRVQVRGWTEHMENYISAADVVVGKPGGLTVAEVLGCGRPLLVTRSLQGQESFNVQFLERRRVGAFVHEEQLPGMLADWLGNGERLSALQRSAHETGRRHGARRIATHALELASRVPAAGITPLPEAG
jgi:processive 1,2-diacylglycerol beta-glucosyltransferase